LPLAMLYAMGDHWFHGIECLWSLVACLGISVAAAVVYRGKRLDLFMLSLSAFCLSFVAASFLWRQLDQSMLADIAMGLFFVAEAAVSVAAIRWCRKEALA